jgi:hypothetical protein
MTILAEPSRYVRDLLGLERLLMSLSIETNWWK